MNKQQLSEHLDQISRFIQSGKKRSYRYEPDEICFKISDIEQFIDKISRLKEMVESKGKQKVIDDDEEDNGFIYCTKN